MKILHKTTKQVLYESPDNTIKETLYKAVKEKADLREADLQGADLRLADLQGADLQGANLQGAELNAIFYKTKVTKKQMNLIINSDLFSVVDDNNK